MYCRLEILDLNKNYCSQLVTQLASQVLLVQSNFQSASQPVSHRSIGESVTSRLGSHLNNQITSQVQLG